jgi:ankyrin repeat protein
MAAAATTDGAAAGAPPSPAVAAAVLSPRERALAMAPLLPDCCGACGRVPAPLRCAGCRALVYCSPGCQRADWREHKARCQHAQTAWGSMEPSSALPAPDPESDAWHVQMRDMPRPALLATLRSSSAPARVAVAMRAVAHCDAPLVDFLMSNGAGIGITPTARPSGLGDLQDETLLGHASIACSLPQPPDRLRRVFDTWRVLVLHTPVAALERPALRGLADSPSSMLAYVCTYFARTLMDDAVAALIERGVTVHDHLPTGTLPLLRAVTTGTAGAVRALLAAGASAVTRYADGSTPLHALAIAERPEAAEKVRLLVAHGADVEARTTPRAVTPLGLAAAERTGSLRAFDALLELGADARALGEARHGMQIQPSGAPMMFCTPLHAAARDNNTAAVRRLLAPSLRHVVDLQARAQGNPAAPGTQMAGATPLHFAAASGAVSGKAGAGALELLLEAGADVLAADANGRPPLAYAISASQLDSVRALLRAGAVPDQRTLDTAQSEAECTVWSQERARFDALGSTGVDPGPALVAAASDIQELLLSVTVRPPGAGGGAGGGSVNGGGGGEGGGSC